MSEYKNPFNVSFFFSNIFLFSQELWDFFYFYFFYFYHLRSSFLVFHIFDFMVLLYTLFRAFLAVQIFSEIFLVFESFGILLDMAKMTPSGTPKPLKGFSLQFSFDFMALPMNFYFIKSPQFNIIFLSIAVTLCLWVHFLI